MYYLIQVENVVLNCTIPYQIYYNSFISLQNKSIRFKILLDANTLDACIEKCCLNANNCNTIMFLNNKCYNIKNLHSNLSIFDIQSINITNISHSFSTVVTFNKLVKRFYIPIVKNTDQNLYGNIKCLNL